MLADPMLYMYRIFLMIIRVFATAITIDCQFQFASFVQRHRAGLCVSVHFSRQLSDAKPCVVSSRLLNYQTEYVYSILGLAM